ncbi:hypothetical protein OEA41_004692 [Lepraria neglecta]|uniref:C2H2-type domain-containing protein n=1 Tax=Lepraria neglecta TaxID=209136 RepID=A0AAD9YZM4_9LECA|nr:hypothetical protein OEA41_004692 [Lepraria neglecta]
MFRLTEASSRHVKRNISITSSPSDLKDVLQIQSHQIATIYSQPSSDRLQRSSANASNNQMAFPPASQDIAFDMANDVADWPDFFDFDFGSLPASSEMPFADVNMQGAQAAQGSIAAGSPEPPVAAMDLSLLPGQPGAAPMSTMSSAPGIGKRCSCIVCLSVGDARHKKWPQYPCRLPGCRQYFAKDSSTVIGTSTCLDHEKNHFRKAGKYVCTEKNCQTATAKFADLKRHYSSRHCINKTKYPCSVIGCKYGGENGFPRKDKLKSHWKNMHEKKDGLPGQRFHATYPIVRDAQGMIEQLGYQLLAGTK